MPTPWRPTSSLENIQLRAKLFAQVREFFFKRDVIEVDTPLLAAHTVTEPNTASFAVPCEKETRYLQTSPEYAMKRLLVAGMTNIYQICKAFRLGEQGALHNSEFTLVEWYRADFDLQQIMQETVAFINHIAFAATGSKQVHYISYADASQRVIKHDLQKLNDAELKSLAHEYGLVSNESLNANQMIDFIFSHAVIPTFNDEEITVVFHYPAAQASLAQLSQHDPTVAERFEVFYGAYELANGFVELTDVKQQRERFCQDQKIRQAQNLPDIEIDERLLASLESGLPACAGVAVGFDRLMMLAAGVSQIAEVLSFDWNSA